MNGNMNTEEGKTQQISPTSFFNQKSRLVTILVYLWARSHRIFERKGYSGIFRVCAHQSCSPGGLSIIPRTTAPPHFREAPALGTASSKLVPQDTPHQEREHTRGYWLHKDWPTLTGLENSFALSFQRTPPSAKNRCTDLLI